MLETEQYVAVAALTGDPPTAGQPPCVALEYSRKDKKDSTLGELSLNVGWGWGANNCLSSSLSSFYYFLGDPFLLS